MMREIRGWLWLALVAVVIVGAVLGVKAWLRRPAAVRTEDDATTHVVPRRPLVPTDGTAPVADTTGRVRWVAIPHGPPVVATVTVDHRPDSSQAPTQLVLRLQRARGLFPELRGRRQALIVQALQGGSRVTVVEPQRPVFELERAPFVGFSVGGPASSSGKRIGIPVGLSLVRIGPVHVGPAVDVLAGAAGSLRLAVLAGTTFYGPIDLQVGIAWNGAAAPVVGLAVRIE